MRRGDIQAEDDTRKRIPARVRMTVRIIKSQILKRGEETKWKDKASDQSGKKGKALRSWK